jgi:hypothetical protein
VGVSEIGRTSRCEGRLPLYHPAELSRAAEAAAANPNLPVELMVAILEAPIGSDDQPHDAVMLMGHTMPTHEPLTEI